MGSVAIVTVDFYTLLLSRNDIFHSICLVAYLRQPTEIVGYFLCTICMLIALMDVDSYEIDLRLLLVLTMVGFSIRLDAVEGVIL